MTASDYSFGDIVLLAFPFTDSIQKKKRPALVLTDTRDGDIVLCRITSHNPETKYDFKISNWKNYNLILPSCIRLHKIATLNKRLVERKLGKLDTDEETLLRDFIRKSFEEFLK